MCELYSVLPHELLLIEWRYADISNFQDVYDVMQDVEYVFHCAGYVSFHNSDRNKLYEINIIGTQSVVDACLQFGITKLCHVSSVAAIGKSSGFHPIDETCEYEPKKSGSLYGYSKYLGELEVWRGIAEGLSAVIVNPSVIIGFGSKEQSSASLFYTVSRRMSFYTTGITGYVSVHDVVDSMILLMKSDICAERFIVSAENLSYKAIFTTIAESLGVPVPRFYIPPWVLHFAGIVMTCISFLTNSRSKITRHTAQTAYRISEYSSQKLIHAISFPFRNVCDEISRIGKFYKEIK